MKTRRAAALVFVGDLALHLSIMTDAGIAADLIPNIKPYRAYELVIVRQNDGRKLLRFSTLSWNDGSGRLEIIAGGVDTSTRRQKVYQRIYSTVGSYRDVLAGSFVWHQSHNHFHFEYYALYTLQPAGAPTTSQRNGAKTTFCIMDTTKVDSSAGSARYTTCGSRVQGMSLGWGDKYGYRLSGQSFDITNMPDGRYRVMIKIDPKNRIVETNDSDNVSSKDICIRGTSVYNPPC